MIGTIDLYKLALTPNDTMYFDSVNAQTEWFNNQEHLSIDNISFNGDRAFRLGQNYLDVVFNYNYVRYKLNDRYIYAFIENVIYNNDNTSSLNISIDLNQTFLQELQTAISTSNVANFTVPQLYFENTYLPYSNKISVTEYESFNLKSLSHSDLYGVNKTKYSIGYIMVNLDYEPFKDLGVTKLIDNGYQTPCVCFAFPIAYNHETKQLDDTFNFYIVPKVNGVHVSTPVEISTELNKFIENFGSYIAQGCIAINFNKLPYVESVGSTSGAFHLFLEEFPNNINYLNRVDLSSVSTMLKPVLAVQVNNKIFSESININDYLSNIPFALYRNPYIYIRVGNDQNHIILNLLDFDTKLTVDNILEIKYFNSCMYPFTTNCKFNFKGGEYIDRNALFNLVTSIPVPYAVNAWQQYYSTHSASVNDGLATQQKYERQIAQNTRNLAYTEAGVRGAMGFLSGATETTMGAMSLDFAKAGAGLSKMINTGVDLGFDIAGATVNYNNSELQREKERALLDIQWNDIKSSPSAYSNVMSNLSVLYVNGLQNNEIDLYIARNINDIIKYHKQYGYQINRTHKVDWFNIKQHTEYDFISFNTITLKSTLPQFYTAMIEQQYEQGVRFWYNYNNFMNFEIPNEEI